MPNLLYLKICVAYTAENLSKVVFGHSNESVNFIKIRLEIRELSHQIATEFTVLLVSFSQPHVSGSTDPALTGT